MRNLSTGIKKKKVDETSAYSKLKVEQAASTSAPVAVIVAGIELEGASLEDIDVAVGNMPDASADVASRVLERLSG
jgi:hypothetical protein